MINDYPDEGAVNGAVAQKGDHKGLPYEGPSARGQLLIINGYPKQEAS